MKLSGTIQGYSSLCKSLCANVHLARSIKYAMFCRKSAGGRATAMVVGLQQEIQKEAERV